MYLSSTRRGFGDTVTIPFPYSTKCVVGGIDPLTGDTIAGCGNETGGGGAGVPVCALGERISGFCVCPTGYGLNPDTLKCERPGAGGVGVDNAWLYAGLVIGGLFLAGSVLR